MIENVIELAQPKKRGGDTRLAAEKNGKKVGPKLKGDTPYSKNVLLALSAEDDKSLALFAGLDGVTKQDLIRTAITRYLIDRCII